MNAPALLARVRETVRGQLPRAVANALNTLPEELKTLAAATESRPEQLLLSDAAAAAQTHRGAIAASFETGLVDIFGRKLAPVQRAAAGPVGHDSFTLVDDDAVELEIALGRLVRKTMNEIDTDQLGAIGARLGELAGGAALEGPANPLGPETALEALARACDAIPDPGPVRMVLVNSLQPHVALALRKLHAELNDMLIAAGVLPRIRRHVQRSAQGAPRPAAHGGSAGSGAAAGGAGATQAAGVQQFPGLPAGMTLSQAMSLKDLLPGATGAPIDLRAIVGALLDGPPTTRRHGARMLANPDGPLFDRAMTTPAPQDLLAQLSQLQGATAASAAGGAGDLAAVIEHLAQTREHPLDQLTGELVAVVFDFVLHDRDIPDPVKAELGRLQIVAFKAALLDRSFFAKREHPLRELLTAIADAAADPQVDAAPEGRFVAELRAIVDGVLAGFTDDLAVFVAARERLAVIVAELREEGEREVEALSSELAEKERAEEIRARAATAVAKRMAAGAPVFVQRFLTDTWTHVLADAERHGRAGDESWDARLALVDDLVWSVVPKQAADLPRLSAMLPKLVPALNRGMKAIDLPAETQRAFLDELIQTHTAAVQAARSKRPPPPAPPPQVPAPPAAAEVIAAPELSLDAQPVLERGAVVEFADVEPPVRARLTWISPRQTVYLFTARGAQARHVSPGDLSAALRDGKARLVGEGGAVIERALAAVTGGPGE